MSKYFLFGWFYVQRQHNWGGVEGGRGSAPTKSYLQWLRSGLWFYLMLKFVNELRNVAVSTTAT